MTSEETIELLHDAGYETGWAISGSNLILWQHNEDPPAPLTRPEVTDVVA